MQVKVIDTALRSEEQRTVKWFLTLLYIISILFDIFYFYIYPKYVSHTEMGLNSVLGYVFYVLLFALLPITYYLMKSNRVHTVKYMYFISYILITMVNDILTFVDNPSSYSSGNIVEVFWLLLSPIFVNKRFYWLVSLGLFFKYLIVGITIQSLQVLFPMFLVAVLSIIAFILLTRFQSYVSVIKASYDQQLEGMVKGIIATLELKDPYTRGHSERVAKYAILLAEETGKFSKDDLKSFRYACLLHDIGKINIPDQILMKPSNLTDEEYKIVKSHPLTGAEAIDDVEALKNYISIIRSHHERWDGKGYPDNLKEEETPMMARIVCIADAFDAMTSSRSYRSALPIEEAYKRIIDGKGTQFDPKLVELFIKVYPAWCLLHEKYTLDLKPHIDL
ncbi:HD-GYP domain-containing protein [Bacillus sp. CGMCC 1.16607]|uniref:HD-GYP domain-containing protein n=1 Tax=Bacillus sp. CGMCC 1.16607 TaxID=3351842 RepID=UPI0036275E13